MEKGERKVIDKKLSVLKSILLGAMPANEMTPIVRELIDIVQEINGGLSGG